MVRILKETRKAKILFNKAGGNAGKNSYNTKISLPKSWIDLLGITKEDRSVELTFDSEEGCIKIVKSNSDE